MMHLSSIEDACQTQLALDQCIFQSLSCIRLLTAYERIVEDLRMNLYPKRGLWRYVFLQ